MRRLAAVRDPAESGAPDPADASKGVDAPDNAATSPGANVGPTWRKLIDRVRRDAAAWRKAPGEGPILADAATTSASGLDPHVSPQTAMAQAVGLARARNLPEARTRGLVDAAVERPWLGFIGENRVNILRLNLALDRLGSG